MCLDSPLANAACGGPFNRLILQTESGGDWAAGESFDAHSGLEGHELGDGNCDENGEEDAMISRQCHSNEGGLQTPSSPHRFSSMCVETEDIPEEYHDDGDDDEEEDNDDDDDDDLGELCEPMDLDFDQCFETSQQSKPSASIPTRDQQSLVPHRIRPMYGSRYKYRPFSPRPLTCPHSSPPNVSVTSVRGGSHNQQRIIEMLRRLDPTSPISISRLQFVEASVCLYQAELSRMGQQPSDPFHRKPVFPVFAPQLEGHHPGQVGAVEAGESEHMHGVI